jgi:hypothetical protein
MSERKVAELPEEIKQLIAYGREFGYSSVELEDLDSEKVIAIHWQPGEKENSLVRTILDHVTDEDMTLILDREKFTIRKPPVTDSTSVPPKD